MLLNVENIHEVIAPRDRYNYNAPINVKPEGGGRVRATQGNLIVTCIPRDWILISLDLSITKSRREENQSFDHYVLPGGGVGILIILFRKC